MGIEIERRFLIDGRNQKPWRAQSIGSRNLYQCYLSSVVCKDNNLNRKYNRHKELYNSVKARLIFSESLKRTSPYLELRCFF